MKLYLRDQSHRFFRHLEFLKRQPVMPYDGASLKEQFTAVAIHTCKSLQSLTAPLSDYDIFPRTVMTHLTQWSSEGREMRVGDTIVQQVFIPPSPRFSQKLIFGARISEIIAETSRISFSYETLRGHVEKGSSTFTLEQNEDHKILFSIHTRSAPGNLLAKITAPFFGNAYQAYCTKQALLYVKQHLEQLQ